MKPVAFDGHTLNDGSYRSWMAKDVYPLPVVQPVMAGRLGRWPLVIGIERPGKRITLDVFITGASLDTLRDQLYTWFDPKDEMPKQLIVEDNAGGNDRYVYAICEALVPETGNKNTFHVALILHGDPIWREVTAEEEAWNITASGQTHVFANNGKADAYPEISIQPTSAKASDYIYKRYIPIRWRASVGHARYPVDILDNSLDGAALITAGKLQADGDDLRVYVNGQGVNVWERWLQDLNTTTSQVWINLDFQPKQEVDLLTAIAGSGAITEIDALQDISGFPDAGVLVIGSEAFTYTGKNNTRRQFTGVTRAAKGTSMAAHSVDDDIWWNQNEVWLLYGNPLATIPDYEDDTYKPAFLLSSTNTSWDYDDFGAGGDAATSLRAGSWKGTIHAGDMVLYTANRGATADPWSEIGLFGAKAPGRAEWSLYNPCGITAANFQNGEKYRTSGSTWNAEIRSRYGTSGVVVEYAIPAPSANGAWESWSRNETLDANKNTVYLYQFAQQDGDYVEAADVTVSLNSSYTPAIQIGAEQGNYLLDCTITNQITGDRIRVQFVMALNGTVIINTDQRLVTYLGDNHLEALSFPDGPRREWLPLLPGDNTLLYTETGAAGVTLTLQYEERHYQ